MKRKLWVLIGLFVSLLGFGGFYAAKYIKLEKLDTEVREWQLRLADYLTFDYGRISTHLGLNTVSLEDVYVTYPILMSIDKLTFAPPEDETINTWAMEAEGVNFSLPIVLTEANASLLLSGDLAIQYDYNPSLEQMDLVILLDFPLLFKSEIQTSFQAIQPSIDLVFNYPNILLASFNMQVQNQGFLNKLGYGNSNDPALIDWMNLLAQKNQRQAFTEFYLKSAPLSIQFNPEYPVPLYRLLENKRLFWQHPAVLMDTN